MNGLERIEVVKGPQSALHGRLVGQARILAVETDFSWKVTDWFSITGNYAYLDAQYRQLVDASLAAILASRPSAHRR